MTTPKKYIQWALILFGIWAAFDWYLIPLSAGLEPMTEWVVVEKQD